MRSLRARPTRQLTDRAPRHDRPLAGTPAGRGGRFLDEARLFAVTLSFDVRPSRFARTWQRLGLERHLG
jgi:hypothetical protein